jgi:hypothetical protein
MPKSPPEKLAQALRANLKRRKEAPAARPAESPPEPAGPSPKKPPENAG